MAVATGMPLFIISFGFGPMLTYRCAYPLMDSIEENGQSTRPCPKSVCASGATLEQTLLFRFGTAALVQSLDDKHRFVVDHVRFAVLTEPLILLDCMIQQRVADVPGGLSIVFAHNRFQ